MEKIPLTKQLRVHAYFPAKIITLKFYINDYQE